MVVVVCYQFLLHQKFTVSLDSEMSAKFILIGRIIGSAISSLFITGLSLLVAYLNNLREEQKQRKKYWSSRRYNRK